MRSFTKSLLPMLGVLAYAGTAGAVVVEVLEPSSSTVQVSDDITVDVVLDSELVDLTSYQFHVEYDPAGLKLADVIPDPPTEFIVYGGQLDPPWVDPAEGSVIVDGIRWDGSLAVDQVVITLVFHAINGGLASSTVTTIAPYLDDYETNDSFYDSDYELVPLTDVTLEPGVTIHHVPEPAAAAMALAAICTLAFLWTRRGQGG